MHGLRRWQVVQFGLRSTTHGLHGCDPCGKIGTTATTARRRKSLPLEFYCNYSFTGHVLYSFHPLTGDSVSTVTTPTSRRRSCHPLQKPLWENPYTSDKNPPIRSPPTSMRPANPHQPSIPQSPVAMAPSTPPIHPTWPFLPPSNSQLLSFLFFPFSSSPVCFLLLFYSYFRSSSFPLHLPSSPSFQPLPLSTPLHDSSHSSLSSPHTPVPKNPFAQHPTHAVIQPPQSLPLAFFASPTMHWETSAWTKHIPSSYWMFRPLSRRSFRSLLH